ncbi:MAG: TGS domain-containing protein, partial [Pseudomonadota bacterium]
MITVTLPDGASREYPAGSTPLDVAESISGSLAKRALVARVNGELFDLTRPLEGDTTLQLQAFGVFGCQELK